MQILGIETSCDETAVAIVNDKSQVLANLVYSQIKQHQDYGGVVPEVAARAHLSILPGLIKAALRQSGLKAKDLSAVAATAGPGLIGGLIVGSMMAKGMALGLNIPYLGINHLEGHALTARLSDEALFPYLLLLVSGGHTELILVRGVGDYQKLGGTIDDAAGECLDKSARALGLAFPGGPDIEKQALGGNKKAFQLPRPLMDESCDFSFSGLKTAAARLAKTIDPIQVKDVCASLQEAIKDVLMAKVENAFKIYLSEKPTSPRLVVAGGVAANKVFRDGLEMLCQKYKIAFSAPPIELCTDNAVMIAWAGIERLRLGHQDKLDVAPRPRWPLQELNAIGNE